MSFWSVAQKLPRFRREYDDNLRYTKFIFDQMIYKTKQPLSKINKPKGIYHV